MWYLSSGIMKRVMIIGGSGSGKSTLARKLGELSSLPVIHGDKFQFRENWERVPDNERNAKLDAAADGDTWIIDGNYSATWPFRASRADTIIFMDPPRYLRVWRVLTRTLRYRGRPRPDMPDGCDERYDWAFLKWTWNYDRKRRPDALMLIAEARDDQRTFILKTVQESEDWLAEVATTVG